MSARKSYISNIEYWSTKREGIMPAVVCVIMAILSYAIGMIAYGENMSLQAWLLFILIDCGVFAILSVFFYYLTRPYNYFVAKGFKWAAILLLSPAIILLVLVLKWYSV